MGTISPRQGRQRFFREMACLPAWLAWELRSPCRIPGNKKWKISIIFCENLTSGALESKMVLMKSDFYAILHRISYKLVFGLPVLKVRFCAPLCLRRFGPNRVATDMEGNGEFDFWANY